MAEPTPSSSGETTNRARTPGAAESAPPTTHLRHADAQILRASREAARPSSATRSATVDALAAARPGRQNGSATAQDDAGPALLRHTSPPQPHSPPGC